MRLAMCKQLQRLRTSLLVTLVTIVVLFKFTVLYAALPVIFPRLHYAAVKDTFISRPQFSFPEVNQIEISWFPKASIGQVRGLYFLENGVPEHQNKNVSSAMLLNFFQPALSHNERQVVLILLQTFVRACVKHNVTFFLYGGTLLGSLRHHDIIPWDDDIDVIANSSDRDSLRQALSFVGDQFDLYCPMGQRWKFFWAGADTLPHKHFRWPYIDIFFYSENTSHIFDQSSEYRNSFAFPKKHIFPLSWHPFAGAMLPVPCKLQSVVEKNYSPSLCATSKYSHKLESFTPKNWWVVIPCRRLYRLFPFVRRRIVGNVVLEELFKGRQVIQTVTLPAICS